MKPFYLIGVVAHGDQYYAEVYDLETERTYFQTQNHDSPLDAKSEAALWIEQQEEKIR